jgi:catalase-peroxidase
MYLTNLYAYEWEKTKSPAGATQWKPKGGAAAGTVPDAHVKDKKHAPMMFTTDIALKEDPEYRKITKRWLENPKDFEVAFAKAWFKLTHRDMGPRDRYVGKDAPKVELSWQDPIPALNHKVIGAGDIQALKNKVLNAGLTTSELVKTAWASAGSFRGTDLRGGANGARVRLAPQKDWKVNNPEELAKVLKTLESIQAEFNNSGKKVSLADLIILAGSAAIEKAAKDAGQNLSVPFTPGRMDITQELTDVDSFNSLELKADPFRNYYSEDNFLPPAKAMVDRANLLNLTIPEMTVLVGGMRALDANSGGVKHGVFTSNPGTLTNDFFVNLLDMSTEWKKSSTDGIYEGVDRKTGDKKWTGTTVDLIFGSHSELRAVAEVYAAQDGKAKFYKDFALAWNKVMMSDRFDVK